MVKHNPSNYKKCNHCGKLKPISDFITGTNAKLQITYSQHCKPCGVILKNAKKTKDFSFKLKKDE